MMDHCAAIDFPLRRGDPLVRREVRWRDKECVLDGSARRHFVSWHADDEVGLAQLPAGWPRLDGNRFDWGSFRSAGIDPLDELLNFIFAECAAVSDMTA